MEEVAISLDLGTTGCKGIAIDKTFSVLASSHAYYPTYFKDGGRVEQHPEDWWKASCDVLKSLCDQIPEATVSAIAVTGHMQDLIFLKEDGVAAKEAILYSDTRAVDEAEEIENCIGGERLVGITGNKQGAASLLAKLLWTKKHMSYALKSCSNILIGAHDYVCYRLCGARVTDLTTASTTGLLNVLSNEWAVDELLEPLAIPSCLLPRIVPPSQVVGVVTAAASRATHIKEGTPVYHCSGDLATTARGAAAHHHDARHIYLGTSAWIAAVCPGAPTSTACGAGLLQVRDADPDCIIMAASMASACSNLNWVRSVLRFTPDANTDWTAVDDAAAGAPLGSGGVLYLPYLSGERCPFVDATARACFIGVAAHTATSHLLRSVMEGVAYALRQLFDILDAQPNTEAHLPFNPIRIVGGGSRSPIWCQIVADVLGCPIDAPAHPAGPDALHVAALGAAHMVCESLGWSAGAASGRTTTRTVFPDELRHRAYMRLYPAFKTAYTALQPVFATLALAPSPTAAAMLAIGSD
mmetsp:Transcript_1807/g.3443  ORF Transcript_1807/g.3443 Transcript_1807/m.3443 type:complete len:526 (-) Transcript_1807:66-1643(-)|eukprot:CAMPEP_0196666384 /NCGR_PEP_ID=MMETSP1086-20130531/64484_1 /TAXON_ID=77921 /ORGANISM="Cyanoptyche  gloeocystis , Strain SAG4.97" /LENGTH=525 /DNA_ID=CAMNT_0042003569 /DNA_START=69 /DNA_END=1646 /DNA_ORIENTATION=-